MWNFRDKVSVAGVGYSKLSRRPEETLASLTQDAVDAALTDAGLTRVDLDGIATSPTMPRYGGLRGATEGIDVVTPWHLSELMHVTEQIQWTGSTNGMVTQSLIEGAMAIATGLCQNVVVYRALHVPEGRYINFDSRYAVGTDQFVAPFGYSMPPAWAAIAMRRYFELYGYSREDFARFIVDNRANTEINPHGFWRKPLTREDYLDARMIADPMSILDCDIPVDGACALLLTSTERARDLKQPPALLTGFSASTFPHPTGVIMTLETLLEGCEHTAERLWASSGLGPKDVDTAHLYDGFSIFVPLWLEGLGIVPRGEGMAFLRDGHGARDGKLPINTGGGALGEGRLHGMSHLAEAVIQVTDRGGERQVPGASRAIATISNGLVKATGFIFSRDA